MSIPLPKFLTSPPSNANPSSSNAVLTPPSRNAQGPTERTDVARQVTAARSWMSTAGHPFSSTRHFQSPKNMQGSTHKPKMEHAKAEKREVDVIQQLRSFGVKEKFIGRIRSLNTPEEIEQWKKERRENYPRAVKVSNVKDDNSRTKRTSPKDHYSGSGDRKRLKMPSNTHRPSRDFHKVPLYQRLLEQDMDKKSKKIIECLQVIQEIYKNQS